MITRIRRADGRVVGYVANGVFFKRLRGSKHMLRKPPAWAFDNTTLNQALAAGAVEIRIYDIETGMRYMATMKQMKSHGVKMPPRSGHGHQTYLYIKAWRTTAKREPKPPEVPPPQLALF